MKSTRWVLTYIVMASVGLWMALFMSLRFMAPGHTQTPTPSQTPNANQVQKMEPPSPGDLPPEFLQETQGSNEGNGKIPPPPSQPPGPPPASVEAAPPPMAPPTMPEDDASKVPSQGPPLETMSPVVPQFASDDQYTYDPTGRRDPFKPYKSYRPVATPGPKVIDSSDPLQRWDLDRFAVVAIMWEVRLPKAMVKDPEGKMYMISKSTKIGRNSGQVVTIREGEVVVVETIDNEGVQTKEVKILELKK